jgi:hypothetical protein
MAFHGLLCVNEVAHGCLNSKKAKKLSSPSQEEQTQKQKKNKNTQVLTPPSVNPTSELRVSNATGDKEFPNKKN